jgi:hypothetical protein
VGHLHRPTIEERGDIEALKSHKRKVRDGRIDETFPSAGAGFLRPQ